MPLELRAAKADYRTAIMKNARTTEEQRGRCTPPDG